MSASNPLQNPYLETKLLREVCRNSFYQFCREFAHLAVPNAITWNWHHEYLCQKFQDISIDVLEGRPKRGDLIVSIAPGTLKCETKGSRIATPDGYRFIEDIVPDDVVISQCNCVRTTRKVTETHSFYGDCVEVEHYHAPSHSYSVNHPFLTQRGWVDAQHLVVGDYVQVVRDDLFPSVAIPEAELDFITLMIFEGATNGKAAGFTSYDSEIVSIMQNACDKLGLYLMRSAYPSLSEEKRQGQFRIKDTEPSLHKRGRKLGPARTLLSKYNIRCLAKDKRLPEQFFHLPKHQKYRFIGLMIATDGFLGKTGEFKIGLASKGLIEDIQLLLLSCGVASRVIECTSKYTDKKTGKAILGKVWSLRFCTEHCEDIVNKVDFIQKQHKVVPFRESREFRSITYPVSVIFPLIKNGKIYESSINANGFLYKIPASAESRITTNGKYSRRSLRISHNKIDVTWSMLKKIAIYEPDIDNLLKSPYCWSRIESIKPVGRQRVYGLTLDGTTYDENNYLSNNTVVHNSSLLSVLLPAYLHAINPRFRFITASFDYKLACIFGRQSKLIMDSPLYQKLFHKFTYSPERQGEYVNQFGGSRLCFSTGQSPTGRHANMIIIDDPVAPTVADREAKIQETSFWMNAVIRPRVADVLSTPLILVMQRLHYQDPVGEWMEYAKLRPGAKVFHISLPAELDSTHKTIPPGLGQYYQDGLLDPHRLNRAALEERKAWLSNADYEAQYLQTPVKSEGLMFKVANMNVRQLDPLDPIIQVIRYWDKAISVSDTACYTAGVKIGKTRSGRWWVLDVRRGKWGLYDRENMIRNTAEGDGVGCIVAVEQEPGPIYEEEYVLTWPHADTDLCSQKFPVQKKLKDIVVGDYVINRHGKPTRVTDVHIQGNLPVVVIETAVVNFMANRSPSAVEGEPKIVIALSEPQTRKIRAHGSHPFLVGSGWINAEDLMPGIYLTRMQYGKQYPHGFLSHYVEKQMRDSNVLDDFLAFCGKENKEQADTVQNAFKGTVEKITSIYGAQMPMPCRCLSVEDGESFVVNDIVVHNSGGRESALNTVRNLAGFTAVIDPAITAKEVRAQPLAIQVEQGNVYCLPAPWNDAFFAELASFPHGKFKDQVDAVVGGFNYLARQQQLVATAF